MLIAKNSLKAFSFVIYAYISYAIVANSSQKSRKTPNKIVPRELRRFTKTFSCICNGETSSEFNSFCSHVTNLQFPYSINIDETSWDSWRLAPLYRSSCSASNDHVPKFLVYYLQRPLIYNELLQSLHLPFWRLKCLYGRVNSFNVIRSYPNVLSFDQIPVKLG